MEEQPAYSWKDVGSIPTTSAVGRDGYNRFRTRFRYYIPENSVAYSNSNQLFETPERVRLVGGVVNHIDITVYGNKWRGGVFVV